ncbi:MAG: hypothetical protein C4K58_02655 [Flavobacteriaceae bacterium]|nr:MAG: hypothetical protein C4K58_02655 [Flavobacteriaceae bacterium]
MTNGLSVGVHFVFSNGKLILAEESYFALMSSMRGFRMKIPKDYTLEKFEADCYFQYETCKVEKPFGAIFSFWASRKNPLEISSDIDFFQKLECFLDQGKIPYKVTDKVGVLKSEFLCSGSFQSTLLTAGLWDVYPSLYASDAQKDLVLLINFNKKVSRTSKGNLLGIKENKLILPELYSGELKCILTEAFVNYLQKNEPSFFVVRNSQSIFELQTCQEIFTISPTDGFILFSGFNGKTLENQKTIELIEGFNSKIISGEY